MNARGLIFAAPLVGTAILRAGQRSVNVVLRSIQKDVTFQPTDMIVANWPVRVGQVFGHHPPINASPGQPAEYRFRHPALISCEHARL